MECINCKRRFLEEDRMVSISGSIMGDEHTDTFYYCPDCQVYTIKSYWDNFTGTESETVRGPLTKTDGDQRISVIRECDRPWDKKCRCKAHRAYFNDTLD